MNEILNMSLEDFMKCVTITTKELCKFGDEKGNRYSFSNAQLLPKVEYLELTKERVAEYKFQQKIDKKDYKMYDCIHKRDKYSVTKNKKDIGKIIDAKVKATNIWNVSNQLGIHTTFEDKESAIKLFDEIYDKVSKVLNGNS